MRSYCSLLASALVVVGGVSCAGLSRTRSPLSLRVMTYNIQAGAGNLDGTAGAIRAAAPDVVALQEVDVHWSARSHFADEADSLAKLLGMQARFAHIYDLPGEGASSPARENGVALVSRDPIVAFTNHVITRHSTVNEDAAPATMPGFLEATLNVRGTRVRVFNTHLDYRSDPAVRRQQVTETLALIGNPTTPTLLFGDLNAGPDAVELQPLFQRLHDSWLTVSTGTGLTYPAIAPVKRIDFVLTSPHFRAVGARVPDTQASDHRPVVVDLVVGGAAP